MGHTCLYLTEGKDTPATQILTSFSSQIKNLWTSVFPNGTINSINETIHLSVGDIDVSILSSLKSTTIPDSGKYVACMLRSSGNSGLTDTNDNIIPISGGVYGINKHFYASSAEHLYDPVYLHIITGKQNKTIMLGLSDSPTRVGAQVLVSKVGDNYVGIQLGVTTYTDFYELKNSSWVAWAGYNDRYDVYVKDPNTTSRTQSFYGPGWYNTSDMLTIVPAIDPWSGQLIPDTYVSMAGPINKAGLDGVVSIANRKFMTGHTYSYQGGGNNPELDDGTNKYMYDGGIVTFVEI